jgi:NAD(P)-dependent dehydrogenase (short-subunit alcohol dehydrogenase family)
VPLPPDSRTALITGAAQGIGRVIALELARRGFHIAVNDFGSREGAESTAKEIAALGRESFAVIADVSDASAVRSMFDTVAARFARLDVLVNNAGMQVFRPLLELEEKDWTRVIDTNLKGCFLCTQQGARLMRGSGGGRIVNIGSGCNRIPFPGLVSYTASKGGIEMFTKVSAAELGRYQITVNCVAPGAIEVERTRLEAPDYAGMWGARTPLGRVGQPIDVARAVAFFAGEDAGFITGQTLWVDGGLFTRPSWPYAEE